MTQAYHSRCTENYQVRPESLQTLQSSYASSKVKNEKDAIPKSNFQLWQVTYLPTKNPINKLAMNNRRLLIAAEFHVVHSVKKTVKNTSSWHKTLSASAVKINKFQDACQILTNQNIKIGRRAWPTRDQRLTLVRKVKSSRHVFPAYKHLLNFSFRGQFDCTYKTQHISYELKKLNLSLPSFEN